MKTNTPIIDVCCGSKMFWFDKDNKNVVFCDNRQEEHVLCDGRKLEINPDVICDFTDLPFEDKQFKLVVFDPPHLISGGTSSWIVKKYGKLPTDWQEIIKKGFEECFRVLEDNGILIFKWSETQIKVNEILKLIKMQPLFGHKTGRLNQTHWLCFMKLE